MLESAVEEYFVDCVKALGGQVRKVKWLGRRHAPDRFAMLPGRSFWAELKAPSKDATAGQAREHERMRGAGQTVLVLRTKDAVLRAAMSGFR